MNNESKKLEEIIISYSENTILNQEIKEATVLYDKIKQHLFPHLQTIRQTNLVNPIRHLLVFIL